MGSVLLSKNVNEQAKVGVTSGLGRGGKPGLGHDKWTKF